MSESRPKDEQHRLSTTEVPKGAPAPGSMLLNLAGVNILGGSHCCTCLLGSLLLHCSLLSEAQVAGAGGKHVLFLVNVNFCLLQFLDDLF